MAQLKRNRLLAERALPRDGEEAGGSAAERGARRRARSVTVNLAESPLGWLRARGLVNERQFAAGEQIRRDWELAQLDPKVTMRWDAVPMHRNARSAPDGADPTVAQIAARRRFDAAIEAVGEGLSEVLWRIVCAGEGMREAERALGWPARAGRLVLGFALERLADFYRMR